MCLINIPHNIHSLFLNFLFYRRGFADFGTATHPGTGGGTHRRGATFDRCSLRGVVLRVVVCGVVLVVCVRVCDLFLVLQRRTDSSLLPSLINNTHDQG